MGTITFEVHPITPTSPRIHACNHFLKHFWSFCFCFFSLHIFLLNMSCMGLLEREKKYPMIFDILILLCLSIQVSLTLHFCYAEAYRCHIMIGGQQWWDGYLCLSLKIFLVLPIKKSDMRVKFKRQLNRTHYRHEPQSSLA